MPIKEDVELGDGVRILFPDLVNIYGSRIGAGTQIGPFVEIQRGTTVGRNCKIQSHSFICEGVHLGDGVFVGHGVMFTNDKTPRAVDEDGRMIGADGWIVQETHVGDRVSIGSGAVILPVTIGEGAMIGAGAVVTRDVEPYALVVGNPARRIRDVRGE